MYFNVFNQDAINPRIDFALVAFNEGNVIAFAQLFELNAESVYIGSGGSIREHRGSFNILGFFTEGLSILSCKYKRALMTVKNTNTPMIKMALKTGFLINGTRNVNGETYLEMLLEFRK